MQATGSATAVAATSRSPAVLRDDMGNAAKTIAAKSEAGRNPAKLT